jgi:D-sedoheptulose 7-phosphate isomerase
MVISQVIQRNFLEHIQSAEATRDALSESISIVSKVLARSLLSGGTVFWCGNGGSASDSQHIAAELVGRFKKNRRPLRSIALNTDTAVLTCIANDFSYQDIFARQIEAQGRPGDVLVGISTSGQSENVLNAFNVAKDMGIVTVGLLGKGGGAAVTQVDYTLTVPSDITARVQESHILIGHILCELIEMELGIA